MVHLGQFVNEVCHKSLAKASHHHEFPYFPLLLGLTKLDGTAKGGVVIGISDQFHIPVKYIGLGERMEDLQIFRKEEFVKSLFGK